MDPDPPPAPKVHRPSAILFVCATLTSVLALFMIPGSVLVSVDDGLIWPIYAEVAVALFAAVVALISGTWCLVRFVIDGARDPR